MSRTKIGTGKDLSLINRAPLHQIKLSLPLQQPKARVAESAHFVWMVDMVRVLRHK